MSNLIPQYDTKLFVDIYEDATDFLADYATVGIPTTISTTNATTLYYLLYARYGNNPIANHDETQFKYKLFSTIFMYGPTWEKRLSMQDSIRQLSLNDMKTGLSITRTTSNTGTNTSTGTSIDNHAFNPGTIPTTQTTTELDYIDQQNVNKDNNTSNVTSSGNSSEIHTKGIIDAYTELWELLDNDVTNDFLRKFIPLFKKFVRPEQTLIFESED